MGDICKIIVTHIFIQVPGLTSIEAFRIELAAVNDTKTEVENSKNSRNSGVILTTFLLHRLLKLITGVGYLVKA